VSAWNAESVGIDMLDELSAIPTGITHTPAPLEYIRRGTLERIHRFLSKPKLRVCRDLKGMCERVSEGYRDRVVVALLQNAHDAHPLGSSDGRIRIAFDPGEEPYGTLYVTLAQPGDVKVDVTSPRWMHQMVHERSRRLSREHGYASQWSRIGLHWRWSED
jgi:hypothetical protein